MTISKKQLLQHQGEEEFDWKSFEEEAIGRLKTGDELGGKDGILAPMIKRILEASLEGELSAHLASEKAAGRSNRRNGKQSKNLKTNYGNISLETSRDRAATFEPKLVGKRQVTLGSGLDDKILSMYSRGMSYADIQSHLEELYGLEISKGSLSQITDKVLPVLEAWRTRPLESVYCVVWMDVLNFKVRHEGRIENRAVYCILGVNTAGQKDVLGLYLSENEGAKFWLGVLTDLQNRGVEDILIACIDNLQGFSEAIVSIFPKTQVQLCVVHQIRNSLKYITSDDTKPFMFDLKKVYQAVSKQSAEEHLDKLEEKWGSRYPYVLKSWRSNWHDLSQYFQYAYPIRRIIYTTNTVEGFNRQLRKITKSKAVFPNEKGLLKLLYLVTQNIIKKWTMPIPKWGLAIQQFAILFEGRLHLPLRIKKES